MMNESILMNVIDNSTNRDESTIGRLVHSSQFGLMVSIIWSILVIFGIIGNGLVIFAGIKYKKFKDTTNCYIINLAITDLLFVLFCIPFTIYIYSFDNWIFGKVMCKLSHFFSRASVQATCLTLTIMTRYRCNLVLKKKLLNRNQPTNRKGHLKVLINTFIIWIIAVIISCPDLLNYSTVEIQIEENFSIKQCRLANKTGKWIKYTNVITVITAYALPLTIITLYYTRLLSLLASSQTKLENSLAETSLTEVPNNFTARKSFHKVKTKNKKVLLMVAVITLNFTLCWLPTQILLLLKQFDSKFPYTNNAQHHVYLFKIIAHTLSYLTPVINPILYAFFNRNFCDSFKFC